MNYRLSPHFHPFSCTPSLIYWRTMSIFTSICSDYNNLICMLLNIIAYKYYIVPFEMSAAPKGLFILRIDLNIIKILMAQDSGTTFGSFPSWNFTLHVERGAGRFKVIVKCLVTIFGDFFYPGLNIFGIKKKGIKMFH